MNEPALEPNAILRGGPHSLGAQGRVVAVADRIAVLKVPNGNRYEHFAPSAETVAADGRVLQVWNWVRCTYIAE